MKLNIHVKTDLSAEKFSVGLYKATNNGLNAVANDIMRIAAPGTPKKTGGLRRNRSKKVSNKQAVIEWKQGYAAVQERGRRKGRPFRRYTTPGTGPKFAKNAMDEVTKNPEKYIKL